MKQTYSKKMVRSFYLDETANKFDESIFTEDDYSIRKG